MSFSPSRVPTSLAEIPVVETPSSFHTPAPALQAAADAPKPITPAEAATSASAPRPVEIPWTKPQPLAADGADSNDETEPPERLPGRMRTVAPRGDSRFPEGLRPGPCCLRNPGRCAEFVASAKIEGTLASRSAESMKLRAMPFGKSGP